MWESGTGESSPDANRWAFAHFRSTSGRRSARGREGRPVATRTAQTATPSQRLCATRGESGSNGGVFAGSASAHSSADPGLLHAFAAASILVDPPDVFNFANAHGGAHASFFDVGVLVPVGGAAPGTPVGVHLSVDMGALLAA